MKLKALLLSLILVVSMAVSAASPFKGLMIRPPITALVRIQCRQDCDNKEKRQEKVSETYPYDLRKIIAALGKKAAEEERLEKQWDIAKSKAQKESVDGKQSKVTFYYETGEVDQVYEYFDGKESKVAFYYKTGEIEQVDEYVDGKPSKVTAYHKTGEVKQVQKHVDGKKSKSTFYYKTSEVKRVDEYVDGEKSKSTYYYLTGEVKWVDEYVDDKLSKATAYHKNGEVSKRTHYDKNGEVRTIYNLIDKLLNYSF